MHTKDPTTYALGHSPDELIRLGTQAAVIDPMTRRTFEEAGITKGMRVLDVASGPGYVATLLADMVGPTGEVIGTDINPTALATAESRVKELGLKNVSFRVGDPSQMTFDGKFDAVVGRYILMFLPDPAAMLRDVAKNAKPGGIIAFHEVDWYSATSYPKSPLYDNTCNWLITAVGQKMNADAHMGLKLPATFAAAGLPAPQMRVESLIGSGASVEPVRLMVDLLRTQIDTVVEFGVATREEIGIETLPDRIRHEMFANNSTAVCRSEIGAWVKLPRS